MRSGLLSSSAVAVEFGQQFVETQVGFVDDHIVWVGSEEFTVMNIRFEVGSDAPQAKVVIVVGEFLHFGS